MSLGSGETNSFDNNGGTLQLQGRRRRCRLLLHGRYRWRCRLLPMLIQDQVDAEAPGLRVLPGSLCQRFKKLTEGKPVEAQRIAVLGATMRMDKKTEWTTVLAVARLYTNNPFAFIKVAVVAALPAFPRGMAVM